MLNDYNKFHKEKLKLIVHLRSVEFYGPHKQWMDTFSNKGFVVFENYLWKQQLQ